MSASTLSVEEKPVRKPFSLAALLAGATPPPPRPEKHHDWDEPEPNVEVLSVDERLKLGDKAKPLSPAEEQVAKAKAEKITRQRQLQVRRSMTGYTFGVAHF